MTILNGISVSGVDRHKKPKENQDYFSFVDTNGLAILVCADGAGSTKHGAIGSKFISKKLINGLSAEIDNLSEGSFKSIILKTVNYSRAILTRYSRMSNDDFFLKDFASTIITVAITSNNVFVAHLGDGAAIFLDDQNKLVKSSMPENGEYINQTYFFTNSDWEEHLRFQTLENDFKTCLVMSDGVTPFALKGTEVFPEFVSPIINFIKNSKPEASQEALEKTLSSPQSLSVSTDDKTLVWYIK